ncbi:insulin-like growth factor-binding protein complex acid labile subunit, partial [Maniola hyperantus]|uniref:insulin-like growth factor-binding protein complex acid labile subunit n=1 Tax=Aphantopus hyperantus TaxID=2795564 RepID=UPI003748B8BB
MALRLLLLAAAVSAVADEPYYPVVWPGPSRGCSGVAGQAGTLGAECALPAGRLKVSVDAAATYLKIVCEDDSTFSCEDLQEAQELIAPRLTPEHSSADRSVNKFEIKSCALPSAPLRCALGLARAGAARLLVLDDVSGALTPQHVEGLAGLEKLRVYYADGGNQTMPYPVLAQLPSLGSFALRRGAVVLRAGAAGALPALRTLELADGGLRSVPAGAFGYAAGLTALGLWGNDIEDIDEHAFDGLSELLNLSLNSNRLSSLPRALLRPCPRLEHVDLYDNQLTSLPDDLFRGLVHLREVMIFDNAAPLHLASQQFAALPALQHLELRGASLQSLPEHLLQNSTGLEHLDLSANNLTSVPADMFRGLLKLRVLNLSNNKLVYIHEKLFWNLDKLDTLDLKGNALGGLPEGVFAGLKGLKVLKLGGNHIDALDKSVFNALSELTELDLSGNRIQLLHPETFSPITKLKILSLANNNLSISREVNSYRFISPELYAQYQVDQTRVSADEYEFHSPLRALAQLTALDLRHNRVALMCDDWRALWNLETLDLSYNAFTELAGLDMMFMSDGLVVDLTHNDIAHFRPPQGPPARPPAADLLPAGPQPLRVRLQDVPVRGQQAGATCSPWTWCWGDAACCRTAGPSAPCPSPRSRPTAGLRRHQLPAQLHLPQPPRPGQGGGGLRDAAAQPAAAERRHAPAAAAPRRPDAPARPRRVRRPVRAQPHRGAARGALRGGRLTGNLLTGVPVAAAQVELRAAPRRQPAWTARAATGCRLEFLQLKRHLVRD